MMKKLFFDMRYWLDHLSRSRFLLSIRYLRASRFWHNFDYLNSKNNSRNLLNTIIFKIKGLIISFIKQRAEIRMYILLSFLLFLLLLGLKLQIIADCLAQVVKHYSISWFPLDIIVHFGSERIRKVIFLLNVVDIYRLYEIIKIICKRLIFRIYQLKLFRKFNLLLLWTWDLLESRLPIILFQRLMFEWFLLLHLLIGLSCILLGLTVH